MSSAEDRIECRTPTPGKQAIHILRWKYDLVRAAILKSIPADTGGVVFKDLPDLVRSILSPQQRTDLGDISWYTTTVKLNMEVLGELERVPGKTPQRLRRKK